MLDYSKQATLEMRLSLYLADIPNSEVNYRLNLIQYWLSDFDFSDNETESDIAYSFSTIFGVIENENNPDNRPEVFKQWFSLLGLYFLRNPDSPRFSELRRLDFASFCLFLVENVVGGLSTANRVGAENYKKRRSADNNAKRWEDERPLIESAITEYPVAASMILDSGQKLTYETAAEAIWPKIQHLNRAADGSEVIDSLDGDPIGRIVRWLKAAKDDGLIESTVTLRKKKVTS